jgi:hypothetical protein
MAPVGDSLRCASLTSLLGHSRYGKINQAGHGGVSTTQNTKRLDVSTKVYNVRRQQHHHILLTPRIAEEYAVIVRTLRYVQCALMPSPLRVSRSSSTSCCRLVGSSRLLFAEIRAPSLRIATCRAIAPPASPCVDFDTVRDSMDTQSFPMLPRSFHHTATWSRCMQ